MRERQIQGHQGIHAVRRLLRETMLQGVRCTAKTISPIISQDVFRILSETILIYYFNTLAESKSWLEMVN